MKGRVDRETKAHRAVAKAQGSRNRAARHPDYQIPLIVPLWLITAEDVWKLSAEAAKQNPALQVRQATDVEMIRVAQHLRQAFDWAIQCDKMQEWEGEPQRKRRWYDASSATSGRPSKSPRSKSGRMQESDERVEVEV